MKLTHRFLPMEGRQWWFGYGVLSLPAIVVGVMNWASVRMPGKLAEMGHPKNWSEYLDMADTWDHRLTHITSGCAVLALGIMILTLVLVCVPAGHEWVRKRIRFWYVILLLDLAVFIWALCTPQFRN